MAKSNLVPLAAVILVALGLGVVLTVLASRRLPVRVSLAFLGDTRISALGCDSKGVWLAVTREATVDEVKTVGVSAALGSQPFSLVRIARTGEPRNLFRDRGRPLALSVTEDGAMWLLFQNPPEGQTDAFSVRRSVDGGTSWTAVDAPRDAIGLAFQSRDTGYCWSAQRLYRTDDGGRSWRTVDVGPGRLAGRMEPARPTLGADGALWVPLHPELTSQEVPPADGKVVWTDGRAPPLGMRSFPGEQIRGVAPEPGGAVLILAPSMDRGCRAVRIAGASPGDGIETLWSQTKGSCRLQFAPGLLLLDYVEEFQPKSFFSTWPRRALVSLDAGKNWFTQDLTRDRVSSICPTSGGFWTVSQTQRLLQFFPVPAQGSKASAATTRSTGSPP